MKRRKIKNKDLRKQSKKLEFHTQPTVDKNPAQCGNAPSQSADPSGHPRRFDEYRQLLARASRDELVEPPAISESDDEDMDIYAEVDYFEREFESSIDADFEKEISTDQTANAGNPIVRNKLRQKNRKLAASKVLGVNKQNPQKLFGPTSPYSRKFFQWTVDSERYKTCVHEAGHTVVAYLLGKNPQFLRIFNAFEGRVEYAPGFSAELETKRPTTGQELLMGIWIAMAGHVAEAELCLEASRLNFRRVAGSDGWAINAILAALGLYGSAKNRRRRTDIRHCRAMIKAHAAVIVDFAKELWLSGNKPWLATHISRSIRCIGKRHGQKSFRRPGILLTALMSRH
jgi:hypothetical protein